MSSRSQSPRVDSTTCRAPAEVISDATSRRSFAAASAKRARRASSSVDLQLAAGLGIDEPQRPELRQLHLARIADLDGHDLVTSAEREQRAAPVAGAAEVGDHHDVRALPRHVADAAHRLADRGRLALLALAARLLLAQGEQEAEQARRPAARAAYADDRPRT